MIGYLLFGVRLLKIKATVNNIKTPAKNGVSAPKTPPESMEFTLADAIAPKEIEIDTAGKETYVNKQAWINVQFDYSPEGLLSGIKDSNGCQFEVTKQDGHFVPAKNLKESSPGKESLCTPYGYSAKEYLEKKYGYSRIAKKCEKDENATDFKKSVANFEKEKLRVVAQAKAYEAQLLEEQRIENDKKLKAQQERDAKAKETHKSSQ